MTDILATYRFTTSVRTLLNDAEAAGYDVVVRSMDTVDGAPSINSVTIVKHDRRGRITSGVWLFISEREGFSEALRIDVDLVNALSIRTIKDTRKVLGLA